MPFPFTLKDVLKRGALVAAANWPVAIVQATADSLFKLLIAAPLIGGVFLVALVVGAEPIELMSLEWRPLATTITSSPKIGVGAVIFELPPNRHNSFPVLGS